MNANVIVFCNFVAQVHSRILEIKKWLGLDDECAGKWKVCEKVHLDK